MKRLIAFLAILLLVIPSVACTGSNNLIMNTTPDNLTESTYTTTYTTSYTTTYMTTTTNTVYVDYGPDDIVSSAVIEEGAGNIFLNGDSIKFVGIGAKVNSSTITITSGGTYNVQGTLHDGQIIVDNAYYNTVKLVFNGVDITCSTSAPVYVVNSEKTVITLAEGTENKVTDGSTYSLLSSSANSPNAAIFSHDDLTINGSGSLLVNASYNNGIQSKDDLKITGGNITLNAVNDGIKGRDSIAIKDGNIKITAGGDGMQADNDEDAEQGYIVIEGGIINIVAGADGIQAETKLAVSGGEITVVTGGGSANSSANIGLPGNTWGMWGNIGTSVASASAKGLKAGVDITITGGIINIDSSDDAIHSNDTITIVNGIFTISSGDDGVHADSSVTINGGGNDIR